MKTIALNARSCIAVLMAWLSLFSTAANVQADGSADLFQARNGTPLAPTDPVDWVKGNAGQANSHYIEGYSIPYRVVISRASPGAHSLVLEWDTRQSGRHAIDYLTHYSRLNPHNQFGSHTQPESILPLAGLAGPFAAPATFAIPAPSNAGSSIEGQPSANFNALPLAERSITIWNGSITSVVYVTEGSLSDDTAISQLRLDFIAHASTVVIAFGGHIASRLDWGVGNSAAEISGSPYHMRMVSFDGSGGNQDRSLQALAVIGPPACVVNGPDAVCAGTTNTHTATVDQESGVAYQWSIPGNTSGASIVGPADGTSVQVRSGDDGTTYTIQVVVTSVGGSNACVREINVNAITAAAALSDKTACLGSSITFSTTASGTGPFTYRWRRGAAVIAGVVGSSLSIPSVTNSDAGHYCVEVTGPCGTVIQCATLTVPPAPALTCPPALTVQCLGDVPPPAPEIVLTSGGSSAITVRHAGDTAVTNGPEIVITRRYRGTDDCGIEAACEQLIAVRDTTPPVIDCPANITIACKDEAGAGVSFSASATDVCDANPQVTCQPPSGSVFAIGTTTVNCVAVDASGNRSECSFTVTVRDTEPPQVVCPASFVVPETTDGAGSAVVSYPSATSTDNCDTMPLITFNPPSGSTLAVGTHVVTCIASDDSGNQTSCTFTVQVVPHVIIANSTADSGPGTLRQAILDANAASGSNMIQFAFLGNPPYTIQLLTPLPPLGDGVTIDGWSQLQFTGSPVIEVNGTNVVVPPPDPGTNSTAGKVGLVVTAGGTVVRGLTLNGFDIGIRIEGPGGNVIQGNRIGTDVAGTMALPNTGDGIVIKSPNNVVGGSAPSERNVISGNRGSGIRVMGASAKANFIRGNYIGVASDATSPLGNLMHGVRIGAGAGGNAIGGSQPGEGNVIAFNDGSGVLLDPDAGNGNAIAGNSIYANGGLGIDLGDDGSTGNDTGDVDEGPNGLQNAPVLSFANSLGGSTTIAGIVAGAPNTTMLLEFFLTAALDGSGAAPALLSLGTTTVTTDANGDQSFSVTFQVAATALQFVTVTATDSANNTSEFATAVPVGTPPVILVQPVGELVEVGASVTFCVTAIGSQPLHYQWRLNGANVPDATNQCLTIPDVQLMNGGSYTVVIANDLGIAVSEPAALSLVFGDGIVADNFADRVLLVNANGIKSGNNSGTSLELGEPLHGGKPGGKSVWYTWTPPGTGIATFSTAGSGFDTSLAVYSGSNLLSLVTEAGDEDSGGFYTSESGFNVFEGLTYQIAIDGIGGASGHFIINWTFEPTRDLLPVITNQPISLTVASGGSATFNVGAFGVCRAVDHDCRRGDKDGHPQQPDPQGVVSYQWYFNGVPIPGATSSTLTVNNVQENLVGIYYAIVESRRRIVQSDPVSLQINETELFVQNVQAQDKFLNANLGTPLQLGVSAPVGAAGRLQAASTVVRGYTGTQVFNTAGSSTEAGEEPICGVVGGASQWISFIAQETGTAFFNTDGSSFDTVVAAFARMTNSPMLQLLGCDNNGGIDGSDSALVIPVHAGRTNFIVIDGVNGATGVLRLNYSLVTQTLLAPMGVSPQGDSQVRVSGRPNLRFTLQRSANLQQWSSLLTTNSASGVFDYVDPGSAGLPGRFYRALVLP